MKLTYHPACELFPRMTDAERAELKRDIAENGIHEAIELYEGKILDGRHRYEIGVELGLEMSSSFITLDKHLLGPHHCPFRYVASKNIRRNLTPTQKAMVAQKLREEFGRTAKTGSSGKGAAEAAASAATGASPRNIRRVERVKDKGAPEVLSAMAGGELDVWTAEKLVVAVPDKEEQAKAVEAGKEEVKRRISGGVTFDVEEIEGAAEAEPARKLKNGAPLVSTKDRKEAVALLDKLGRVLTRIGLYERFISPLSQIRETLTKK